MKIIKLNKKEEVFKFEYSIEQPSIKPYSTNRVEYEDGEVVWFGISTNWKRNNNIWYKLSTNHNAKPLEKYLPDIIYGSDRTIWEECVMPIYEELYIEYYKPKTRNSKIDSILSNNIEENTNK